MSSVLYDAQIPKAIEYVKFDPGCFGLDIVNFRFGRDYDLALAWMYTRHRDCALVR